MASFVLLSLPFFINNIRGQVSIFGRHVIVELTKRGVNVLIIPNLLKTATGFRDLLKVVPCTYDIDTCGS